MCFKSKFGCVKIKEYFKRKHSWNFKVILSVITVFGIPFIVAIFYAFYVTKTDDETCQYFNTFLDNLHKFYTDFWGMFISLILAILATFNLINVKFKSVGDKLNERIEKQLQKTKIVFENGIEDYDEKYLFIIQMILNDLEKYHYPNKVNHLYFIDNSSSIKWWSESMTGYIALLAKWKGRDTDREITRFFIYSKNELLSPITVKTIAFHSMLGFNTYIFSKENFDKIFDEIVSKTIKKKKEVFLWTNSYNRSVNFHTNENVYWSDIIMWQSFWDIDKHDKNERDTLIKNEDYPWFDYKENKRLSKNIDIWLEFIPKNNESEKMISEYNKLIEALKANAYCCRYEDDVSHITKEIKPKHFGIKIKTQPCLSTNCFSTALLKDPRCVSTEDHNGIKFGYVNSDNISAILTEYSNTI